MLYLEGVCSACGCGQVEFWRCSDGVAIVLLCDECNGVWLDVAPRTRENALSPTRTLPIPGTSYLVGGGAAGEATRDEVERAGWLGYVASEAEAAKPNDDRPLLTCTASSRRKTQKSPYTTS